MSTPNILLLFFLLVLNQLEIDKLIKQINTKMSPGSLAELILENVAIMCGRYFLMLNTEIARPLSYLHPKDGPPGTWAADRRLGVCWVAHPRD